MKTIEYVADLNTQWLGSSLTLYTKWLPRYVTLGLNFQQILWRGWIRSLP